MKRLLIFLLILPVVLTHLVFADPDWNTSQRSISEILNPDGTLDLGPGIEGSFDISGFQMVTDLAGEPRFLPSEAMSDDEKGLYIWDDQFSRVGVWGGIAALAVMDGYLYVGGGFYNAGESMSSSIAKWDGSEWSALGTGMEWRVYALTVMDGDLYAGGKPSSHIARWYKPELVPVYRFFNTVRGGHLYTISEIERDYIIGNLPEWSFEGPKFEVFNGPIAGSASAYRFFNTITGIHLYTISEYERDMVLQIAEWNFEGSKFFVRPDYSLFSTPVYRFFNHVRGGHLYTISEYERDAVLQLPEWNYEGIPFYVYPLDE